MTDPFAPDPFAADHGSPDPIIAESTFGEPISPEPVPPASPLAEPLDVHPAAAGGETGGETAGSPQPASPWTPLYAAAGLAEVLASSLRGRLNRGQSQAKTLPEMTKSRLAEAERQLKAYRDQLNQGYVSLANRGKPTVDSTIGTVKHLSGRTQHQKTEVSTTTTMPPVDQPIVGSDAAAETPVVVQPVVVVEPLDDESTHDESKPYRQE